MDQSDMPADPGSIGSGSTPVSVVIAEDHELVREGLRLRLESDGSTVVVEEVGTGGDALLAVARHHPDVLVLDVNLPDRDGMDVATEMSRLHPDTKIIICSALSGRAVVERAFRCGAHGYVSKLARGEVLLQAVRSTLTNRKFVDPGIAAELMQDTGIELSPRELQVLKLMSEGMQNTPIAAQLNIGTETTKSYVSKILAKLEATGRTDAVAKALRCGLIS